MDLCWRSQGLGRQFNLPLLHAANRMLAAMHRPYLFEDYHALVSSIRSAMPHASIGSDVIVGFPGETPAEFDRTESLLRDLPLTHLHVFPYSDRPGTEASAMRDKVDGATIRDRGQRVRAIGSEMTTRFRRSQVGTVRRALTVDDGLSAVTDNYLTVRLGTQYPRNQWIEARID